MLCAINPTNKNQRNISMSNSQLLMDWVSVWVTIRKKIIAAKAKNMDQKGSVRSLRINFSIRSFKDKSIATTKVVTKIIYPTVLIGIIGLIELIKISLFKIGHKE